MVHRPKFRLSENARLRYQTKPKLGWVNGTGAVVLKNPKLDSDKVSRKFLFTYIFYHRTFIFLYTTPTMKIIPCSKT